MERVIQFERVRLDDGRELEYTRFGASRQESAHTTFYLHGIGGTAIEAVIGSEMSQRYNTEFIGINRPGYRYSTFAPNRTLLSFADDLAEFKEKLGITRKVGLVAHSAGGAYSLAFAWRYPDMVANGKVDIISGMPPLTNKAVRDCLHPDTKRLIDMARNPHLPASILNFIHKFTPIKPQELFIQQLMQTFSVSDNRVVADKYFRDVLNADVRAVSVNGDYRGLLHDASLVSKPWGFPLEDIGHHVGVWYSDKDVITPESLAQFFLGVLPNAKPYRIPGAGHLLICSIQTELAKKHAA